VVGYDQRGHGASDGARGALQHADDLLFDLGMMIDAVRAAHPGPLVLLGHSLGGLVAARMVAGGLQPNPPAWQRKVDALVLSSPAFDPGMSGAQKLLLALLGPIVPRLALSNGLKPEWISRDPAVVKAYIDDPRVHDRVTPRMARFIVDAGMFVRAQAAAWRVPTLLLYAAATAASRRPAVPRSRKRRRRRWSARGRSRRSITRSSTSPSALRCSRRCATG